MTAVPRTADNPDSGVIRANGCGSIRLNPWSVSLMLSGDENKPVGKSGTGKKSTRAQGKKAESRRRKSAQLQEPQPVQLQEQPEAIEVHDQAAIRLQSEPETVGAPLVSIES